MDDQLLIAQLKAENAQLLRYKRDLETLLETTDDFIYIKDRHHKFVYTSTAFAQLTRHENWQELVGKDDFDIFPSEHAERYFAFEKQVIEEGKTLSFHEEPYFDLQGELRWVSSTKNPVFDETGQVIGLVGISKDITELKRQQEKTAFVADHDDLTNMLNRRAFFQYGQKLLAAAERDHSSIAVLYMDLDKFKQVNDRFSHMAGDKVLAAFGQIIQNLTREADLSARFGGDEFVVLVKQPEKGREAAIELARRVIAAVDQAKERLKGCSCSIGIAEHTATEALDVLVQRADKAMYLAKADDFSSYHLSH